MAAGGLTKFIHGTRQGTSSSPRKHPQKLILEDANKVYKYTSTEPSDTSTRRGAFSTNLGSYPDTSLDDIQDQVGGSELSRSASNPSEGHAGSLVFQTSGKTIETRTVGSTQREVRPNGHRVESTAPFNEQDAAISALIGADNVQEYEEFLQSWATNEEHPEKQAGNEVQAAPVLLASRGQIARMPSIPPVTSNRISTSQAFVQRPSISTLPQLQQSSSRDDVSQDDRSREPLFRPPRRAPAESIFQAQTAPQNNGNTNQPSRSHDQNPATGAKNIEEETPRHINLPSHHLNEPIQPSKAPSITDRWSLKRTANLDSIKLAISNQQLLSTPYTSLDEQDKQGESTSATFFNDIDQVITTITNQTSDEETLLSHLSQLKQEEWAALGDTIHSKQGELVNELKSLYAKKQDVSMQYQQEIHDMMRQVENNDKIVTNKLQRLRSLGAQVLNEKSAME